MSIGEPGVFEYFMRYKIYPESVAQFLKHIEITMNSVKLSSPNG